MSSPVRPTRHRSSTLNDLRRESVWNLISKFPTPFTSDAASRKAKDSRQRLRPTLEPLKIPENIDAQVSFLDLSSSTDCGMFPTSKATSTGTHSLDLDSVQTPLYDSPETYYNISLSPDDAPNHTHNTLRRPSSDIQLSQLRSHWSDDSSDEEDDSDDVNEDNSSPLSPTFLIAWRNRFGRTSTASHRHSRSLPSPAAPVSPRTKPRASIRASERELDQEVSMSQILEDGPIVTVRPRTWSDRVTRRHAMEDVASQFGQWRGFSSR